MDALIKSALNTNHTSVEDVVHPCYKLLSWLAMKFRNPLALHHVEHIVKAATFVDECFAVFGAELSNALLAQYPFEQTMLKVNLEMLRKAGCLPTMCTHILHSPAGHNHALVVERMLQIIQEKRQVTLTDNIYAANRSDHLPANQSKMQELVRRLFQLPPKEINAALERTLSCMSFAVLGYVFLEPAHSAYHDKCVIVVQKICNQIASGTVPPYFLWSLFYLAANSKKGIQFYWQCLENETFADSLLSFFMVYLTELSVNNVDICTRTVFKNYAICDVLFLVYGTLATKSPCRQAFHAMLRNCNESESLFKNIINKVTCIYN